MRNLDRRLTKLEADAEIEDAITPWPGAPIMVGATADAYGTPGSGDGYVVTPETDEVMAEAKAAGRLCILVVTHDDPDKKVS